MTTNISPPRPSAWTSSLAITAMLLRRPMMAKIHARLEPLELQRRRPAFMLKDE